MHDALYYGSAAHMPDYYVIHTFLITWRKTEMSEYQRYEFMTVDRPLTKKEQEAVDALSSHIEVSATHALVEYNWGTSSTIPLMCCISILMVFSTGPTGDRPNW